MLIFPAIDLMGGRVVRLFQGDYAKSESYGDDPVVFAGRFRESGASALHLVDLDGAKEGRPQNFDAVRRIAAAVPGMLIELGGGIRGDAAAEQCFEAGISRIILGTSALRDRAFLRRMVGRYGERVAVGVDARGGRVAVGGWLDTSDTDSIDFCGMMRDEGVRYIIYTDIARDGAGTGANLAVYEALCRIEGVSFTASGGVSSLEDLSALREMGLYAAIIGKALYRGEVKLEDAIKIGEEKIG